MPDFTFTFTITGISPQRATVIRDKITQRLGDDGVLVTSMSATRVTAPFQVVGVDTATSQVFDETVEAVDESAARTAVIGATATRVVAMCHQLGASE